MPHYRPLSAVALAILALSGGGVVQAQPADLPSERSAQAAALPATVARDNLWNLVARLPLPDGASRAQAMVALLRLNPEAFVQGNMHRLRVGVVLRLPAPADILAEPAGASVRLVEQHLQALGTGAEPPSAPPPRRTPVPSAAPVPDRSAPVVPAPAGGEPVPAPVPAASAPPAPASAAPEPRPAASAVQPPATTVASAASAAVQPASAAPRPASPPVSEADPESGGWVRWLPYLLLAALGGGAWLLWQRRGRDRQQQRFTDSVVSSFYDENGVRRPSRPKLIDVSQAGVEMARTVETLRPAAELVRSGDSSLVPPDFDGGRHGESALKLEMARTSLEVGRVDAARLLLQAVQREGNSAQQLAAGELLGRLAPT